MEIFNKSVCLPVLHFASKYSRALRRNLLVYQREKEEEKRREEHLARRQEQAAQLLLSHRGEGEEKKEEAEGENKEKEEGEDKKKEGIDPFDTDDWFDSEDEEEEEIFAKQLLEFDKALLSSSSSSSSASFPSLLQREGEDEKEEEEEEERDTPIRIGSNYPPRWEREIWRGWRKIFKIGEEEEGESEEEREKRQKLRIDAVKRILHPAMGPALIDGSFFRPLPPLGAFPSGSEEEEEQIASLTFPSFATLTELARRLPDAVVIFTSSDEAASKRAIDFALIEKLAEEDMRKKLQIQEEKKKRKENRDRRRAAAEALGEDFEEEEEEEEEEEDEDEEEEASTFDPVVAAGKKASLQALEEFKRRKKVEEKILLQSAKLFAANRVPVLVINGDRGVDTVQRAITHFLKPFLVHRQSLFLSSQCIPLDKETSDRFLASGLAKVSKFGLFSPLDVDKMVMPGSLERPVLLNDRIYYPGAREEDVKQFCLYPSLYLSSSLPSPSQCLPRCAFLGPPLSGKTTIARLIADWCGAVYVSPEKAVKKCLDIPKSSSRLIQRALHELRRGRRVPSCCLVRLIHQRLRQLDTLQKGYILDGFPRHLAHAKRLQALDSYHRIEISSSSSFSLEDQHEHSPSSSLSTTPDQSPSHRKERKEEEEEEEEREGRRERSQSALELSRDRDLGFRGVATGKREEEDTEEEEDERGRRGEEERKITKGGERHSIAFGEKTGASMKYRDMLKDVFLVEQKRKKEEEERKRRKERKLEEEKIKKEKGKNDDEIEEEEEESEGSSRDEENEEDKEEEEEEKKKEGVLERKTRSLDVTKKREEEEEFGEKESVMKKSAKPRPHTSALEESSGTSQPWNEEEKEKEEREKRKIERKGRANTISLGEKEEEEEENTSRYTRHTTAGIDLQEIQEEKKKKKKKTSASSPSFEKEGNEDLPIPSDGESQERCENEKEEEGEQERKKKEEETSREDRGNSTTKERREEEEDEARDESVNREDRGKEKEEESDREENKKKKGESHPHDEKRQKNEKKKEEEENKKEKNARMKKKKKFVARTPEELQAHREEKKKRRIDRELETIHVDASLPENDEEESAIDLIFILQSNYVQTLQRAKDIALEHQKNFYCGDERDVQRTLACHDRTWREYQRDLPSIQSYYSHTYNNVILIPSEKSVWEQFEIARKEILSFVHRKHSYLRRKAEGKACHSFLLGRNRRKTLRLTSTEFSTYCPVCWTIHGSLVEAGGIFVYQVDYQEKVYLCCTRTHLEVFLKSPDVYLREAIPETLPRRLTLLEISHLLSSSSPLDLSINGYCPVALVEEKKYLKGNASTLLVSYDSRYWTFTSQDALETFMKFPASYAQLAVLPPKLEAEDRLGKKPRTLQSIAEEGEKQTPPLHSLSSLANELKDAFTFLEVTSVELLTEALTIAGLRRFVYPGRSVRQSALQFLSLYLHAHNELTPPITHRDALHTLNQFITDCQLPFDMRDKIFALYRHLRRSHPDDASPSSSSSSSSPLLLSSSSSFSFEGEEDAWSFIDQSLYERWLKRFDSLFKLKDRGGANLPSVNHSSLLHLHHHSLHLHDPSSSSSSSSSPHVLPRQRESGSLSTPLSSSASSTSRSRKE